MPPITQSIQADGPVIDLEVAIPAALEDRLKRAGQRIPSPIAIRALIDTGASNTVLQGGIASALGLSPINVVRIATPTSSDVPCNQYFVGIILPQPIGHLEIAATEAPMLGGVAVQCLIGRDILEKGVFVYIGTARVFTLAF